MAKNSRQPYAVSLLAGHQHSAESWGTGRAVARIPRVSGGGTGRSGQAAFGNMVRKGRMYAPTKIWRKWHRKINVNQKRYAVASALAASALPSLVLARGHRVGKVPEIPLVLDDRVQNVNKTRDAIQVLKAVNAYSDVLKVKRSRKLRAGQGKMRGRRYVQRRGPLVVYSKDNGIRRAFRNLPGVELCQVSRLNLLQLAPGAHLGRFIVWTKSAFEQLDNIWGTQSKLAPGKKDYQLPRPLMTNADLTRLINSDEVQSKVRSACTLRRRAHQKKNPLTNLGALVRLNPYAMALRRAELGEQQRQSERRAAIIEAKRTGVAVKKSPDVVAKEKAQRIHKQFKRQFFYSMTGPHPEDENKAAKDAEKKEE